MKSERNIHERVEAASRREAENISAYLGTPYSGHTRKTAEKSRLKYGSNELKGVYDITFGHMLKRAFLNPFSVVLMTLAIISTFTGKFLESDLYGSPATVPIMLLMILVSGSIRLYQDIKARNVNEKLLKLVDVKISVYRDGRLEELPPDEIVVGDRIVLGVGDRVPADMRMTSSYPCFVSESMLTGESGSRMKTSSLISDSSGDMRKLDNILFQGSVITSGKAEGIAVAVGKDCSYGELDFDTSSRNDFDKGANSIAWVLTKFMVILVPLVFIVSGLVQGNWILAFLFALSVAVGLMPEMLPMVITACLAKGSRTLGSRKTIVKDINAIEGLGSMDVLCVDKTGTLTEDKLVLEYWLDVLGNESSLTLDLAYMSAMGMRKEADHMDSSILKTEEMNSRIERVKEISSRCRILSSLPFDYDRRISSVIAEMDGERFLISKGSPDVLVPRCNSILWKGVVMPMGDGRDDSVRTVTSDMTEDGLKVLAIAARKIGHENIEKDDESALVLVGYIAFFDAPKKSAAPAIEELEKLYVHVKLLTGDNIQAAKSTAIRLGMDVVDTISGNDIDEIDDDELRMIIENVSVFADLTPRQKSRIVRILRENGHTVGFLGDGMNDLSAILSSDVGVSVDNASEALKDSADIVLLKKDLSVVADGIRTGRKAFVNMTKYIRITASSNLGNILAVVFASVFLPFFPMTSVQLLLLNLLYDILCLAIPWDNVDEEQCRIPLEWSGQGLSEFMMVFGPVSLVFDILTFGFLMFILCPGMLGADFFSLDMQSKEIFISLFQTGWFLESMWTQVMILHLLRTEKIPYLKSRPSVAVTLVTVLGTVLFTWIVMTDAGSLLGMARLPWSYFLFLAVVVILYLLTVTAAKHMYIRRHRRLI